MGRRRSGGPARSNAAVAATVAAGERATADLETSSAGTREDGAAPGGLDAAGQRMLAPLQARVGERLERYVSGLVADGRSVEDVGGIDVVADAIEAALPTLSPLADRAGPVFTVDQLRRLLGGVRAAPLDPQAIYNRANRRTLIGAKTAEGQWVFPAFQFQARPGRLQLRDDVLELWRLLPAPAAGGFDAWTLLAWLTGPRADLDGYAPLRWLDDHGLDDRLHRAAGQLRRRAAA